MTGQPQLFPLSQPRARHEMRVNKPSSHSSSSRQGMGENQGHIGCQNQGPRYMVPSNHPRHLQLFRQPLLKHLGAETSHSYSALPKSLICKIVSIISGCFTPLSFGVVCQAALLPQQLTHTLLHKVASFITSQLLGLKNILVQLDLKLFPQRSQFFKNNRTGTEESIFFLACFLPTSTPNYRTCENWPVILFFFVLAVGTN